MKQTKRSQIVIRAAALLAMGTCSAGFAQVYDPNYNSSSPPYVPSPAYGPPVETPEPVYRLDADQIDQLTGTIALYPDPLIAEILPACTYPDEVLAAAGFVKNGVPAQNLIDAQPWEDCVKALVHYPTVLQMMASHQQWMEELGTAFTNQQDDVMDSIQRLRGEAQQNGALVTTPQQDVVVEDNEICIRPVADDVVYIPEYDPAIVFVYGRHFDRGFIHFSAPCAIGVWLNYGPDWHRHYVREDVHWDHWHQSHNERHDEHRDDHRDEHGGPVHVVHEPAHRWVRNNEKPIVVVPHAPPAEHRGFEPRPAPAARPPEHNIGDYKPRRDAEREQQRGQASLHREPATPAPRPAPKPEARPAPHAEPAHPQPSPQPHPAPAPNPPQPHGGGHK